MIGRAVCEDECQQNDMNYIITSPFLIHCFIICILALNVVIRPDVLLDLEEKDIFFTLTHYIIMYSPLIQGDYKKLFEIYLYK